MTADVRWAVYRDRAPLSPIYLGDILAPDRGAAESRGAQQYGGRVVCHRTNKRAAASPELERAVRTVTKRDRGGRDWRAVRGRDFRGSILLFALLTSAAVSSCENSPTAAGPDRGPG